ncbi:MAG TPA: hypothetical protein VD791_02020 [Burkholderiales bacterium]|nr:hypothetical protein [Burkholderiales bacterium]
MAYDEALYSDVIITWLGAIGVWSYLDFVHRHRTGSVLERRVLFLLYCLCVLLAGRGFYWLLGWSWLEYVEMLPATLIPLAVTLVAEGLIRQHVSMPMKIYVAAGTAVFLLLGAAGLLGRDLPPLLLGLMAFQVSVIAAIGWILWRTDRAMLKASEIRLNNAMIVAAMFAVPLVVTDFREALTWIPRRLGAAGALIFVYVLLRMTYRADTRRIVVAEVAGIFLRAAVMAAAFMAITGRLTLPEFFGMFPLSVTFVLVFTIFYRLKAVSVENRGLSFLQWLLHARMSGLDAFAQSLRHLPLAEEHVLLRDGDLARYDVRAIVDHLGAQRGVVSLTRLRTLGHAGAAEQLIDILERHGMNHVGLVGERPPALLLLNTPLVPGAHLDEIKINLILKLCRVLSSPPLQARTAAAAGY